MQLGRFFAFFGGVFVGGLLQLWILVMILLAIGHPVSIAEILGDGGLFFFATSLVVNSWLSLADYEPMIVGKKDFNITFLCFFGVVIPVIAYYTAILSNGGLDQIRPFGDFVPLQISCLVGAIAYWIYSGIRTGLFVKKSYDIS